MKLSKKVGIKKHVNGYVFDLEDEVYTMRRQIRWCPENVNYEDEHNLNQQLKYVYIVLKPLKPFIYT